MRANGRRTTIPRENVGSRKAIGVLALLVLVRVALASTSAGAEPFAYVAHTSYAPAVSVIDTASDAVVGTVVAGVPLSPRGVAITPDGTRAYVAEARYGNVLVIDTASNTVTATVPLTGPFPFGVAIAPDGAHAYVVLRSSGGGQLAVIDTATNAQEAAVPVGGIPMWVAVTPDGARAYVTNQGSNDVSVIDTTSNTEVARVAAGSFPSGIAVTPDGTRAYVVNQFSSSLSVIRTADHTVVATIPVDDFPFLLAISPDGTRAYVTHSRTPTISVIDTVTNTVAATIPLPLEADTKGIAVTPDGTRAYVANGELNTVLVIDLSARAFLRTIAVGTNPFDVAITPARTITVVIDIKPESFPNSINLSSAGVVPVAILGSSTFDAAQVDPATVALAGARVKLIGKGTRYSCSTDDVNADGFVDLVCHVLTAQLMIEPGDWVAVLEAQTFDGQAIRGQDSIKVVPD